MTTASQEGGDSPWGRLSKRVMSGQLRGVQGSEEWKSLSGHLLPGRLDRGLSVTSLLRPKTLPTEEVEEPLSEEDARLALLATALQSRSIYLFDADHPLRQRCVRLVRSRCACREGGMWMYVSVAIRTRFGKQASGKGTSFHQREGRQGLGGATGPHDGSARDS